MVVVLIASGMIVYSSAFAYDTPTVARVGAHAGGVTEVRSVEVGSVRVGFALRTVEAPGTSTTFLASHRATEAAGAGADNVVNGVRLRAQLTAEEIAGGHAFDKHVLQLGELPGITTRAGFASTIEDVVMNCEMRVLTNGRTAY